MFNRKFKGSTLTENGIMLGLVCIACIAILSTFGGTIKNMLTASKIKFEGYKPFGHTQTIPIASDTGDLVGTSDTGDQEGSGDPTGGSMDDGSGGSQDGGGDSAINTGNIPVQAASDTPEDNTFEPSDMGEPPVLNESD